MYWRVPDDHTTIHAMDELCAHGNKSQERLTLLACCSMLGEKLDLLIIGNRSDLTLNNNNNNNRSSTIRYYSNQNSWMTNEIFMDFANKLNAQMQAQNRFITVFMRESSSHSTSFSLSHIRFILFPKFLHRRTDIYELQPINAGIQQCLKGHYRLKLVESIIFYMKNNSSSKKSKENFFYFKRSVKKGVKKKLSLLEE
jgi:hypothetical protein